MSGWMEGWVRDIRHARVLSFEEERIVATYLFP